MEHIHLLFALCVTFTLGFTLLTLLRPAGLLEYAFTTLMGGAAAYAWFAFFMLTILAA